MKMDEETRKHIRLLIRLRKTAAELDRLSEFELFMLANEIGVSEEDMRRFAYSDNYGRNEKI